MAEMMKEMVYGRKRIREVLVDDTYNGIRFIVLNLGTHPCCYIACSEEFARKHCDEYGDIEGIDVHGGITFSGVLNEGGEHFIGWDYAHCNDWAGYYSDEENIAYCHIKHTTEELVADCKSAIDDFYRMVAEDSIEAMRIASAERTINGLADEQKAQLFGQLLDEIKTSNYELYKSFVLGYEG